MTQMTKEEFFTLLINLVKHVDLTSMQVVVPALLKMLREMPESFQSASQEHPESSVSGPGVAQDLTGSRPPDSPSLTYVEDETDIMVLKNEVLTEIIPKVRSSRLSSTDSSCPSRKR